MSKIYTNEQLEWVRTNYPLYPAKELTILFNEQFNMNITPQKLKNICGNHKIKSGRTGRFEKGRISHNKGRPITEWMSPEKIKNSAKTRFKKGDPSFHNSNHNELPIGAETTDNDGYIRIKLNAPYPNPISKNNKNWVHKHIYIYEQAYGPIPKGYNLIFLDGNRQNCALENLQLVSRDIHVRMNQNKYYGHSQEITKAGIEIFQTEKLIKEGLDNV